MNERRLTLARMGAWPKSTSKQTKACFGSKVSSNINNYAHRFQIRSKFACFSRTRLRWFSTCSPAFWAAAPIGGRDKVLWIGENYSTSVCTLYITPSQKNMVFCQSSSRRSKKIRLCEYISPKKFQDSCWSRTIPNGRSKFWEFAVVVGFSRFSYHCSVQYAKPRPA